MGHIVAPMFVRIPRYPYLFRIEKLDFKTGYQLANLNIDDLKTVKLRAVGFRWSKTATNKGSRYIPMS